MKKIWKFFGSVYAAAILLSTTAVWVIAATFVESKTDSHLRAAAVSYDHPFFKLLLAGYFINILVSALQRYPFKRRHIPFLLTHLGLLMVIGGTFVKMRYGVQGSMTILEGSASQTLFFPHTSVVQIVQKTPRQIFSWDPGNPRRIEGLAIRKTGGSPHAKQQWQSWFKNQIVQIAGFAPIPIGPSDKNVIALKTEDVEETIREEYLKNLQVSLHGIPLSGIEFDFFWNPDYGIQNPAIVLPQGQKISLWSPIPEAIAITNRPRLLFLQDPGEDAYLITISETGEIESQAYPHDKPGTIVVYDEGFSGYAAQGLLGGYQIESPLTRKVSVEKPPEKFEERNEMIELLVKTEGARQKVRLVHDPQGAALAIPVLHGRYLMSYRCKTKEIPYHLRLRRARQISYPGTRQPASYECDLWITDTKTGEKQEQMLSMNRVWESQDGWRFYLAGMSPQDESGVKRVHLAVNYDPAKYWLTYPGGAMAAFGILGLFFGRKLLFRLGIQL